MDPAGPYFHDTPNEVRLDPSDANFVDVIHTNAVRLFFELGKFLTQIKSALKDGGEFQKHVSCFFKFQVLELLMLVVTLTFTQMEGSTCQDVKI